MIGKSRVLDGSADWSLEEQVNITTGWAVAWAIGTTVEGMDIAIRAHLDRYPPAGYGTELKQIAPTITELRRYATCD